MNLENIPTYLKEHGSWCNWKYEKRKSSMTKVPYNPKTGNYASVKNPNTFIDFNTAVVVMDNYDGIGIRVDGKIIAIDLDHCIEKGKVKSWASEIVSRFRSTYIEKSPSGTGLRIILFVADGYTYDKNTYYIKKGNVEVYVSGATNRFVTITGDAYFKNEITEDMDALKWLLEKYMKRKSPKNSIKQTEERTVSSILSRREYLGHTVNFKTRTKSFKSKKKIKNDPSQWQIFENTHEAIISQDTFDTVQRIRDGRRRPTPLGEMPILSGMVYCADCGSKLYQVRCKGCPHEKEYMVCSKYRKKGKEACTSHQIRNVEIEAALLYTIQQVTAKVKSAMTVL